MRQPSRIEPRWPAALAILAVLVLLAVLPGRVRLLPAWVPYVVVIAVLLPMAGVGLTTLSILAYLVRTMVGRPGDIGGLQLLTSSIAVWAVRHLGLPTHEYCQATEAIL